jgi:hypothetical protein
MVGCGYLVTQPSGGQVREGWGTRNCNDKNKQQQKQMRRSFPFGSLRSLRVSMAELELS